MVDYIYGKNVVLNSLKRNKEITNLYLLTGRRDNEIENLAKKKEISIEYLSRQQMDKLVNGNHQGYIAEIEKYEYHDINDIVDSIPEGKIPLLVALDGIQDPHNLGAVLRTMACVGGDGVIIEKNRSVQLNGTVAKVSVGAIDIVKVAQVANLPTTLRNLKEKGFWVIGTDVNNASDYRSLDYKMPTVLVIGSEGKGMHRLVRETCDFNVTLPMESDIGSLNASVAAGILLYEIYSQRFPL
ncbi:MAG: 23S rRNA (guanosine(2251)-2'-O)-methyltransferase RlmB [Erysipelotrichaceae bacterium]|nr:23S rRNA (guanosine(2251)-2'-O)-methyltransferase RlmB [Erysipelotrichaceae bacterium]